MGESPEQFIVRLKINLDRWVELSGVSRTYICLSDLFVKEQFINACPCDLTVHIQERAPKDLTSSLKLLISSFWPITENWWHL